MTTHHISRHAQTKKVNTTITQSQKQTERQDVLLVQAEGHAVLERGMAVRHTAVQCVRAEILEV